MRKTGTNVSEYIELYDRAWASLMEKQHLSTLREDVDRSILTTWTLSFESLRSQNEEAANLLMLWAFLDNRDLWYELLAPALDHEITTEMPCWFIKCVGDKLEFKECIGLLLDYSFINAKTGSSSFSMHSVLHLWCFHALGEDKAAMSWLALTIVASAAPTAVHDPLMGRRLLPHCDHVYSMVQRRSPEVFENGEYLPSLSHACHQLGKLYQDQGKMKEAEDIYLRALIGKETAWGPEHKQTLQTVNNLGVLYRDQGKLKEAEEMLLRALIGKETAWGPGHTSTLGTVNNLGCLYNRRGKMKEAEDMYLRALVGYEKERGPEHQSTLGIVNNLGNLYNNQGKMKEAEQMYLRALTGKEKIWGPEHTETLATVNNLGILYADQGKMKEAEEMHLGALVGYEKACGPEHKSALHTRYILGRLYNTQGKSQEAEDMYLQAISGYEKAWDPGHKPALKARYHLGHLLKTRSMFGDAARQFELVVQGYTKLFGPEHDKTVDAKEELESCQVDDGREKRRGKRRRGS